MRSVIDLIATADEDTLVQLRDELLRQKAYAEHELSQITQALVAKRERPEARRSAAEEQE